MKSVFSAGRLWIAAGTLQRNVALLFLPGTVAACSLKVPTEGVQASTDPLPAGGTHVLFIGNSLTYVNDLPSTLVALAASVKDTIRAKTIALPDFALIDHYNGGSNAVDLVRGERWDYVVLQQGPSAQQLGRDTLVLATQKFDPYIRAAGGKSSQFSTWPASDRRTAFDSVLVSSQIAARAVGGIVLAAGEAWTAAWAKDPSLQFWGPDGFHPSLLGTYLSALVIYEGVTGHDARLLPARAIVAGVTLDTPEATVRLLQQVAHETNAAYLRP